MKIKKHIDPFLIIGVLISIIISLCLYLTGIEKITSITIALLCIIITLQIDQNSRNDQKLENALQFSSLLNKLNKNPGLNSLINEIATSYNSICENSKFEFYKESAKIKLEDYRNFLHDLNSGYLKTSYYDINPLILATQNSCSTIRAVSIANVDLNFWLSTAGKRYWKTNIEAIEKGVKIERIFVYSELNKELKLLAKQQLDSNVSVYIVQSNTLTNNLLTDMIIYDDNFTYEAIVNSDGTPLYNKLSANKSDINNKIQMFNQIKNLAEEFHETDQ